MKFDDLYELALEAKGTKPGERIYNAQQAGGPSGFTSSPIGKSNYNPVEKDFKRYKYPDKFKGEDIDSLVHKSDKFTYDPNSKITKKHEPKDIGMMDQVSVIKLLGKAFQLLKNDEVFTDQMRGIMNGFRQNRKQISAYQESILKSKPKHIDNLWGRINNLITIISSPKNKTEKDVEDFKEDLIKFKALRDEAQTELDDVYSAIEKVTQENEETNDLYMNQLLVVIKDTAKILYKKQAEEILTDPAEAPKRIIPLHELDVAMIEKELTKDAQTQLQLLEMLFSDDSKMNPLILFLELQKQNYDEHKNNFFEVRRGDNYSITIENLYKNLPLFKLTEYFSNVIMKSPTISLNMKQSKRTKALGKGDDMIQRLENVKNEKEWEELRSDLIAYIKKQKIDKDRKKMLTDMAKGRLQAIRGRASAATKLISALKSAAITESFDELANKYASSFNVDINDFMIDLQEVKIYMEETAKKRFKKVVTNKKTGRKKTVRYGQAGKAKDGGDRIRPGSSKGDAYCARSNKIKGNWRDDPNSPNRLSRKKWKCKGSKSTK